MNDCIWWTKMRWYIMQCSFVFKWVPSDLLGEGKSLHAYDNESVCVFSQRLIVYLLVSNTKSEVFPFIYLFVCFSNNKPPRHLIYVSTGYKSFLVTWKRAERCVFVWECLAPLGRLVIFSAPYSPQEELKCRGSLAPACTMGILLAKPELASGGTGVSW